MDQLKREFEGLCLFVQAAVCIGLGGYVIYCFIQGALLFLKNLCCC